MATRSDYEGMAERIYRFLEGSRDHLRAFDEGDDGAVPEAVRNLKAMSNASLAIIEVIAPAPKKAAPAPAPKPAVKKAPVKKAAVRKKK